MFDQTVEVIKINKLKKLVKKALAWNTFESLCYQSLFLCHQAALFLVLDRSLYGMYGALFAFLFLTITILNGSLDLTLVPLFSTITQTKKSFSHFIFTYLFTQTVFMWCASFSFGALFLYAIPTPKLLKPFITLSWISLLSTFIASEGTKKNIRALLHLAFKNKATAFIEVSDITLYVVSVWLLHFFGLPFSMKLLVIPFVIVSLFATTILMWQLYCFYKTLPYTTNQSTPSISRSLWKNRSILYLNQLSCAFFSGNFLLPFFASYAGFRQTGMAAFINTIAFTVASFMRRVFAPSGAALFAQTKTMSQASKKNAFSFFSQKYLYVLVSLLALFLINGHNFLSLKIGKQSLQTWTLIYIFFLIHFLDNMFIIYDKLFAAEEKSHYSLICNVSSFIGCVIVAYYTLSSLPIIIFLLCILLRLFAFFVLTVLAKKMGHFSFKWQNSFFKLAVPVGFSLFIFILFQIFF